MVPSLLCSRTLSGSSSVCLLYSHVPYPPPATIVILGLLSSVVVVVFSSSTHLVIIILYARRFIARE